MADSDIQEKRTKDQVAAEKLINDAYCAAITVGSWALSLVSSCGLSPLEEAAEIRNIKLRQLYKSS